MIIGLLAGATPFGDIDVTWSAGVEGDSNVSVIEIDTQTASGDESAVLDLGIGWTHRFGDETRLRLGYDLGVERFSEFDQFDTDTHRFSADVDRQLGEARVGLQGSYTIARLGGAGFLNLTRVSPYVQRYVADRTYLLRASYIHTDKAFDNRVDRDATVHAGDVSLYRFFDGARRYVQLGVRLGQEDTVADEFDHQAIQVRASAVQRLEIAGRASRLEAYARWEGRDYDVITPSIGEVRDDDRYRVGGTFDMDLTKRLFVRGEVRYNDNQSNLPGANFDEVVGTVSLGGTLF